MYDPRQRRRELVLRLWRDWGRNLFRLPTPKAIGKGIISRWAFLVLLVFLSIAGFRVVTPRDAAVLAAAYSLLPPNTDLSGAEGRTRMMRTAEVTLLFDFVLTGVVDQPADWYASLFGKPAVPVERRRLAAFFELHNRIAQLPPEDQRRRMDEIVTTSSLFKDDLATIILPKLMSTDHGLLRRLFAGDGRAFDRCIAHAEEITFGKPANGIDTHSQSPPGPPVLKRRP